MDLTTIKKSCKVCKKEFETIRKRQDLCSPECARISRLKYQREYNYLKRVLIRVKNSKCSLCIVTLGLKQVKHDGKDYLLCPNHYMFYKAGVIKLGQDNKDF